MRRGRKEERRGEGGGCRKGRGGRGGKNAAAVQEPGKETLPPKSKRLEGEKKWYRGVNFPKIRPNWLPV